MNDETKLVLLSRVGVHTKAVPRVKGLAFVGDIAWWAEGKKRPGGSQQLSEAAAASL